MSIVKHYGMVVYNPEYPAYYEEFWVFRRVKISRNDTFDIRYDNEYPKISFLHNKVNKRAFLFMAGRTLIVNLYDPFRRACQCQ